MKHNRNPRRLHRQKRACWVNRIPVMSTSSWRWLTNSVKPVKRRFTNSGIRSKHRPRRLIGRRVNFWVDGVQIMDCAGSVPDAERKEILGGIVDGLRIAEEAERKHGKTVL